MTGYCHAEGTSSPRGGLLPKRTDDPAIALRLVAEEGAAILTGVGTTADDAVAVAWSLFAGRVRALPPAAEVRAGGVMDRPVVAGRVGPEERLGVHTDGFGYGDLYPDYLMLLCGRDSPVGGESFLVDGYALLDGVAATPDGRELVGQLLAVPVDQTESGMHRSVSPLVGRTRSGRRMVRRFPFQRPRWDSTDPDADATLIAAWDQMCKEAATQAPRFKLAPGEAVIGDNYRVLHGREPYDDPERLMWRVWIWSDECLGVPSGCIASDTRYASVPSMWACGWPTITADAVSVSPHRGGGLDEVRTAIQVDGAAIIRDIFSVDKAVDVASQLLSERALRIRTQFEATRTGYLANQARLAESGPDRWGRVRRFTPPNEVLIPHNDGYGFGDLAPDYLFLWCERPDLDAGASWLIDGARLLDALEADEVAGELTAFCWSVPIDHSEPGFIQNDPSPIARSLPGGRVQVRHNPYMVPASGPDEAAHAPLVSAWVEAVTTARDRAHRFYLSAGDLLCIDNYRMMHGRDPYFDQSRRLVAIWGWTTEAVNVPDQDMHLV